MKVFSSSPRLRDAGGIDLRLGRFACPGGTNHECPVDHRPVLVLVSPTVSVIEPATVTPVIVTWSADYNVSGTAQFGLSVNSGPCRLMGPSWYRSPFSSREATASL